MNAGRALAGSPSHIGIPPVGEFRPAPRISADSLKKKTQDASQNPSKTNRELAALQFSREHHPIHGALSFLISFVA